MNRELFLSFSNQFFYSFANYRNWSPFGGHLHRFTFSTRKFSTKNLNYSTTINSSVDRARVEFKCRADRNEIIGRNCDPENDASALHPIRAHARSLCSCVYDHHSFKVICDKNARSCLPLIVLCPRRLERMMAEPLLFTGSGFLPRMIARNDTSDWDQQK